MKTTSVLLSEPKALLAMQVKFPMSVASIWPINSWEPTAELVILYFKWEWISAPLCIHLKVTGKLPLLIVQEISVRSPITILGGIERGFKTGASVAVVPEVKERTIVITMLALCAVNPIKVIQRSTYLRKWGINATRKKGKMIHVHSCYCSSWKLAPIGLLRIISDFKNHMMARDCQSLVWLFSNAWRRPFFTHTLNA